MSLMTHPQILRSVASFAAVQFGVCLTSCNDDAGSSIDTQTPHEAQSEGPSSTDPTSGAERSLNDTATSSEVAVSSSGPSTMNAETSLSTLPSIAATEADAGSASSGGHDSALDAGSVAPPPIGSCEAPLLAHCGDRFEHDTSINGQADTLFAYNCTARGLSGPEVLYSLEGAAHCDVEVRLTELTVDLNLILMRDCDRFSDELCSNTPIDLQDGEERLSFVGSATELDLVTVDGYDGASGSYAIEFDCACAAPTDASAP